MAHFCCCYLFKFGNMCYIEWSKDDKMSDLWTLPTSQMSESLRKVTELTLTLIGPLWTKPNNTVHTVRKLPGVCTPLYTIPGTSLASLEVPSTIKVIYKSHINRSTALTLLWRWPPPPKNKPMQLENSSLDLSSSYV